jgi:hypothetical protein
MSDGVSNSSAAADQARRAAEEAARRAAQQAQQQAQQAQQAQQGQQVQQQQQQEQQKVAGPEQAERTRDALAEAAVDNDRAAAGAQLIDRAAEKKADPALPAVQPTAEAAPTDNRLPYQVVHNPEARLSAAETKGVDDEKTRAQTASAVGERVAQREALQSAFAGPENLATAEKTFAALPAAERARLANTSVDKAPADVQSAVFSRGGAARDRIVENIRDRAGIDAAGPRIDDGRVGARSGEVAKSLIEQGQAGRLTPEQKEAAKTSAMGLLRAGAGALETVAGLTASSVGVGVPVAAHGIDNVQAGLRQFASGKPVQGVTEQAVSGGLQAAGVSKETADQAAAVVDTAASIAGPLAAARLGRAATVERAAPHPTSVADDVAPKPITSADVANPGMGATKLGLVAKELKAELADDVAAGTAKVMAGNGSPTKLRDADRLAATYGGDPSDWSKVTSSQRGFAPDGTVTRSGGQTNKTFESPGIARPSTVDSAAAAKDLSSFEVHAYVNTKTGQMVEPKLITEMRPDALHKGSASLPAQRYEIRDLGDF